MADNLTAEIVAIGTEILLGEITDTNSVFLAQCLRDLGINVYFMTSVGDNTERIAKAVSNALERADLVMTCGGLGPTVDDMTRQAVADAVKRPLVFQPDLLAQIEARFSTYRVKMPQNNARQAYIPEGAIAFENPVGTAPVFVTPFGNKRVISLPGVPRELKFLMKETITPYLMSSYLLGMIRSRILRVAGVGESALDEMIGNTLLTATNPTVGLAAHNGIIDVRLTAKADTVELVEQQLDTVEKEVMAKIGRYVYGREKQTIEEAVVDLLLEKEHRIQVIEAGLEGVVSERIRQHKKAGSILIDAQTFSTIAALRHHYRLDDLPIQELAAAIIKQAHTNDSPHVVTVVVLSEVDVLESADNTPSTAVAVAYADKFYQRDYGFGALSELAQTWVGRWSLAMVWRSLKELDA